MTERPPYEYEKHGLCCGCGKFPVKLTRTGPPTVYNYRCDPCIVRGDVWPHNQIREEDTA